MRPKKPANELHASLPTEDAAGVLLFQPARERTDQAAQTEWLQEARLDYRASCEDTGVTPRILFRPVGLRELELILDSDARSFPPRLPEQPIFYPVLTCEYAEQIARDWNTRDPRSGFAGFVTEFGADTDYLHRFETKVVGTARHQEIWVPAAELPDFNAHLLSRIRVTKAFYGSEYQGPVPLPFIVRTAQPTGQLKLLTQTLAYSRFDFWCEVSANWKLILANYGFWSACPADQQGLSTEDAARTLEIISQAWREKFADLPLPVGSLVPRAQQP